jgi:UDP:flavonoid glycosyltransferase YjiC (YdhE family)
MAFLGNALVRLKLLASLLVVLIEAHNESESELNVGALERPPSNSTGRHIAFVSVALRGHATPLLRIAEEMIERGYRVTFATHTAGKEWVERVQGLEYMSAGDFPTSADDMRVKLRRITKDPSHFRGILSMFNEIYVPAAKPLYDALLPQYLEQLPDLMVFDIGTLGAHDLAHQLDIPYVINSPTLLFDLQGDPAYIPTWGSGLSRSMSLWQRCVNLLSPRLLAVALTPPFMLLNKNRWELNLKPFRSQHETFGGARILVNTAFGLEYPRPLSPLITLTGPILPAASTMPLQYKPTNSNGEPLSPLPPLIAKWLQRWVRNMLYSCSLLSQFALGCTCTCPSGSGLSKSQSGVVYVSFGSMPHIEAWQARALVQGLSRHPTGPQYLVLWTLPNDQRTALPTTLPASFRVKVLGGVPHLKVLAHESVKLVLSHCGAGSAQEALYYGKPVLCLPFFGDQPDIASVSKQSERESERDRGREREGERQRERGERRAWG